MKTKTRKSSTWLILDCHYLAWRAHYAMRGSNLNVDGNNTEVLFSFLRDVLLLQTIHNTQNIVFCFDRKGPLKRQEIYPEYKANRYNKTLDPQREQEINQVKNQINLLRRTILKKLGFRNIFSQKGYEADDVIAQVCRSIKEPNQAIIIGSDSDLYQLLSKNTIIWNPQTREPFTIKCFQKKYGISPRIWPEVKAIAGCSTDNIKGCDGVGEITALKFWRGELPPHSKTSITIVGSPEIFVRNMKLVTLPFPGTKNFVLQDDCVTQKGWNETIDKFHLFSLKDKL